MVTEVVYIRKVVSDPCKSRYEHVYEPCYGLCKLHIRNISTTAKESVYGLRFGYDFGSVIDLRTKITVTDVNPEFTFMFTDYVTNSERLMYTV